MPSRVKASAIPRPMPRFPPVTTAIFPASDGMGPPEGRTTARFGGWKLAETLHKPLLRTRPSRAMLRRGARFLTTDSGLMPVLQVVGADPTDEPGVPVALADDLH